MQAVGPAPPRHGSSREFIDDDDLAIRDEVLHFFIKERMRPQCRIEVMQQTNVARVVQAFAVAQDPGLRE